MFKLSSSYLNDSAEQLFYNNGCFKPLCRSHIYVLYRACPRKIPAKQSWRKGPWCIRSVQENCLRWVHAGYLLAQNILWRAVENFGCDTSFGKSQTVLYYLNSVIEFYARDPKTCKMWKLFSAPYLTPYWRYRYKLFFSLTKLLVRVWLSLPASFCENSFLVHCNVYHRLSVISVRLHRFPGLPFKQITARF